MSGEILSGCAVRAAIQQHEALKDWPRDPASGRLLCAPQHPMPKGAPGQWAHTNVESDGSCYEGCCDDYRCKDCGATWRIEAAQ